jgi:hypothetical protein
LGWADIQTTLKKESIEDGNRLYYTKYVENSDSNNVKEVFATEQEAEEGG